MKARPSRRASVRLFEAHRSGALDFAQVLAKIQLIAFALVGADAQATVVAIGSAAAGETRSRAHAPSAAQHAAEPRAPAVLFDGTRAPRRHAPTHTHTHAHTRAHHTHTQVMGVSRSR
jgi:hypothetical protein